MAFSGSRKRKHRIWVVENEGCIREALAVYFLSAPPYFAQTPRQKAVHRQMARLMAEIEEYSLLQSSNLCRPLKYGDISSLIRATLEACSKVLARKGTVLEVKAAKSPFTSAAEPRIVAAAVVSLVSAAVSANPFGRICANVDTGRSGMIVAVKGDEPIRDKKALALAAAAARVHKGGVALSDGTAAFSIRAGLTGALGFFTAPTVDEILKNPLSAVNIGLGYD